MSSCMKCSESCLVHSKCHISAYSYHYGSFFPGLWCVDQIPSSPDSVWRGAAVEEMGLGRGGVAGSPPPACSPLPRAGEGLARGKLGRTWPCSGQDWSLPLGAQNCLGWQEVGPEGSGPADGVVLFMFQKHLCSCYKFKKHRII